MGKPHGGAGLNDWSNIFVLDLYFRLVQGQAPWFVEGGVDRDARRRSKVRPPTTRAAMERREAPGSSQRAPRPGTPPPLKTLGPGILARRLAYRTAGLGGATPAPPAPPGAPSPLFKGIRNQGNGRIRASEKQTPDQRSVGCLEIEVGNARVPDLLKLKRRNSWVAQAIQ